MLHTTKLQDNWPSSSGEEDCFYASTLFGNDGHLGHVTWTKCIRLSFSLTRNLYIKNN